MNRRNEQSRAPVRLHHLHCWRSPALFQALLCSRPHWHKGFGLSSVGGIAAAHTHGTEVEAPDAESVLVLFFKTLQSGPLPQLPGQWLTHQPSRGSPKREFPLGLLAPTASIHRWLAVAAQTAESQGARGIGQASG